MRLRLLVLAVGVAMASLLVPAAAASATVHHAAAAPRIETAASNCTFNRIVAHTPVCYQYRLAAPYGDCYVQVGDWANTARYAYGAAWVGCGGETYTFRMKLWLDFINPPPTLTTAVQNTNGKPVTSTGENITTTLGWCGGPERTWQTYMKLSINGSPYSNYFLSNSGRFQPGPCQ